MLGVDRCEVELVQLTDNFLFWENRYHKDGQEEAD